MTDSSDTPADELFNFPCEFPIKVMGKHRDDFDQLVVSIIRQHVPNLSEGAVTVRESRNGRYLAVTVTVTAENRTQLDAIYQALTDHEHVLMAL